VSLLGDTVETQNVVYTRRNTECSIYS